jgi:poly(A) polymerase
LDRLTVAEHVATWSEADFFVTSMAVLLRSVADRVREVCRRLKLSKEEFVSIHWLVENEPIVINAGTPSWPQVQRVLIEPMSRQLITLADATSVAAGMSRAGIRFCEQKLQMAEDALNPTPLITGDDLVAHGLRPGEKFKTILEAVRDAQLMGRLCSKEHALRMADKIALEFEATD